MENQKEAARSLALERGLGSKEEPHFAYHRSENQVSPLPPEQTILETTPFPAFEMHPSGTAHTEASSPAPSQSGPSLILPQAPIEADRNKLDVNDQHKDGS